MVLSDMENDLHILQENLDRERFSILSPLMWRQSNYEETLNILAAGLGEAPVIEEGKIQIVYGPQSKEVHYDEIFLFNKEAVERQEAFLTEFYFIDISDKYYTSKDATEVFEELIDVIERIKEE